MLKKREKLENVNQTNDPLKIAEEPFYTKKDKNKI